MSGIESAKSQLQGLRDSADQTLSSLRSELANLQGDYVAVEKARAQQQRQQIQSKLQTAQQAGDAQSVNELRQALQVLNQVEAKRLQDARQRTAEQKTQATQQQAPASQAQRIQQAQPVQRHEVTINLPSGKHINVQGSEQDASALIDLIKQAGMRAN